MKMGRIKIIFIITSLMVFSCMSNKRRDTVLLYQLKVDLNFEKKLARDMECYRMYHMENKKDSVFILVLQRIKDTTYYRFYLSQKKTVIDGLDYSGYFNSKGFLFLVRKFESSSLLKTDYNKSRNFTKLPISKEQDIEIKDDFSFDYIFYDNHLTRGAYNVCDMGR